MSEPEQLSVELPELFSGFRDRRTLRQTIEIALRRLRFRRLAGLINRLERI